MEFFDIHYCQALLESNKSEDIFYKIEELKTVNNRYIRDLLRIEIKLSYETSENIHRCKKYNLIIIKNLIDDYFIKQEIKKLNTDLNINYKNNYDLLYRPLLKQTYGDDTIISEIKDLRKKLDDQSKYD